MTNDEFTARFIEAAGKKYPTVPSHILASFEEGKARRWLLRGVCPDELVAYFDLYDRSPQEAEAFICGLFEEDFPGRVTHGDIGGYASGKGYVGQDYHAYASGLMTLEFGDYLTR